MGGEIGSEHMIHGALAEVDSCTSSAAVGAGVNMLFCLLFLLIMKSALVPPFFVRDLIEILPVAKSTVYYSNDMVPTKCGRRHRTWPCGVGGCFPLACLTFSPNNRYWRQQEGEDSGIS